MHKQRRWRKKSCGCGFLAANFLLALDILGGKLWSSLDLKTWKRYHNYLLALYKNVTYLLLIFSETLCVHSCSGYTSNINGSFCLDKIWKTLKTPTPFSSLSPSHMCREEEKKERIKGVPHPSSHGSISACSKNTQYSGRKPSLSLGLLQLISWL